MLVELLEGVRTRKKPLAKCKVHALHWAPCFPQCVLHSLSFHFIKAWLNSRLTRNMGLSPSKRIFSPCFPVPYTSRSSENNENQAAPFCSAQLPEISLEPDKPGYRKTQVEVKMASARMLWNLGTWEYFPTICFFMINYFVTWVYNKM